MMAKQNASTSDELTSLRSTISGLSDTVTSTNRHFEGEVSSLTNKVNDLNNECSDIATKLDVILTGLKTNATVTQRLVDNALGLGTNSMTITHVTNLTGEIGTFCETTGDVYDGYDNISSTNCICCVKQATGLSPKVVGIITSHNEFATHGDVLVKVVDDNYALGDILTVAPDGRGKKAQSQDKMFMMINAIPRAKVTSLKTGIANTVAAFLF